MFSQRWLLPNGSKRVQLPLLAIETRQRVASCFFPPEWEQVMSSYNAWTKHPETGEVMNASWIDDALGRHRYGVLFPGENFVRRPEDCEQVPPPVPPSQSIDTGK